MQALSRAATVTAGVMFRALDCCPPVDLRYDEYARAMLRAEEVAYPLDDLGIRRTLVGIFKRRGLLPPGRDLASAGWCTMALRSVDIAQIAWHTLRMLTAFLDSRRKLFDILTKRICRLPPRIARTSTPRAAIARRRSTLSSSCGARTSS